MEGDGELAQRVSARLSAADGRKFALTLATAFGALAALLWWRGGGIAPTVAATLAASLLLAALLVPTRLGPVQRAWMRMALAISRVTTPILMGAVYFLSITPIGLIRRGFGRNPLIHSEHAGSFWVRRPEHQRRSDLQRQF